MLNVLYTLACSSRVGQLVLSYRSSALVPIVCANPPARNGFFSVKNMAASYAISEATKLSNIFIIPAPTDAQITYARVANYHNPDHPELNDFGDCALLGNNGTTNYFRVDWFSPPGLSSWGDGRTIILGTEGYLELRKNCNITQSATPDHIYLVDGEGEIYIPVHGKVGYPFFGQLILDCMHRTETAMTQAHGLKGADYAFAHK